MVDFANKNIGGGVLSNGTVQQEILFVCFPELFATMCLCEEMNDHEAIVIQGTERFTEYEGYSDSFKFKGPFDRK